jgi:small-conductance mechanosensitive channel
MNTNGTQLWLAMFTGKVLDWMVRTGLSLLVVLVVAFAATRLLKSAVRRLESLLVHRAEKKSSEESLEEIEQRIHTLSELLKNTAVTVIWVMALMIALKEVGIDIGPLLAGAGIVGLAVGFGAQNLVRDVVSGFFIILENQVGKGDVAVVNGTGGSVEAVNLRTIVLRDGTGTVHVFPNGTITTLSNMTKDWSAMIFDIGVAYKEDTDRVTEIMKEVAEGLQGDKEFGKKILEPMEIMGVDSFADSAVVIKARIKTKPIQQWSVGREYRRRLKKAFDEKGIEIPFPHRTITWADSSGPIQALVEQKTGEKG